MEKFVFKEEYTLEQLSDFDIYYDQHIEELLESDNDEIIKLINYADENLGYSLTRISLEYYISDFTISIQYLFEEEMMETYLKYFDLIDRLNICDYGLGYTLGDYHYRNGDISKALYFYEKTFKPGYDLSHLSYFDSLERYISISVKDPKEILIDLIKNSKHDCGYSLDFTNTYLLLISKLDEKSDDYLYYIDEAIEVAREVAREIQSGNRSYFSDSDEERDLCELVCLKFIYFVNRKEYLKAWKMYQELTEEIHRSDCTRYYHARDKYYYQMLKDMSEDYPELTFFDDVRFQDFEFVEEVDDPNNFVKKEVLLKNERGEKFKFIIDYIYKGEYVHLVPVLPLLGNGGIMFRQLEKTKNGIKLTDY